MYLSHTESAEITEFIFLQRITQIERIFFFEHRKTLKALKVQRKNL